MGSPRPRVQLRNIRIGPKDPENDPRMADQTPQLNASKREGRVEVWGAKWTTGLSTGGTDAKEVKKGGKPLHQGATTGDNYHSIWL